MSGYPVPCTEGRKARDGTKCFSRHSKMYDKLKDPVSCVYPRKCSTEEGLKAPPKKVKRVVSDRMKKLASILRLYMDSRDSFEIPKEVTLEHFASQSE